MTAQIIDIFINKTFNLLNIPQLLRVTFYLTVKSYIYGKMQLCVEIFNKNTVYNFR